MFDKLSARFQNICQLDFPIVPKHTLATRVHIGILYFITQLIWEMLTNDLVSSGSQKLVQSRNMCLNKSNRKVDKFPAPNANREIPRSLTRAECVAGQRDAELL